MTPSPISITRVAIHLASFIGVLIGLMATFVIAVTFQTMRNDDPPLKFEEGKAVAFVDADDTVVLYLRPFVSIRDESVSLERSVLCEINGGEVVFDVPPYLRTYKAGERVSQQRVILYPASLPIGTHCSITTDVKWSPTFSMNWHIYKLQPLPFVVTTKEEAKL